MPATRAPPDTKSVSVPGDTVYASTDTRYRVAGCERRARAQQMKAKRR